MQPSNRPPRPEPSSRTSERPGPHPNVLAYKRMIAAFNANDLGAVEALVDPSLEYTLPGKSPLACSTRGVAPHLQMLKAARELSGGTLRLEPRAVAADGDYLVVWGRITAERAGKRLDSDHCVMYRFSQGKIVEGRTVPVDQYAFDAFWS
ncbi:MAG: nuclear transport factor 2 family protein [Myxococcales bacterium]